jgi:hypothetical protein
MRCDLLGSAVPDLLLLPEALDFDAGHLLGFKSRPTRASQC